MLRSNLSTRPFYNERAVHVVLALVAAATVAITAANVARIVSLSGRLADLAESSDDADRRAFGLTQQATGIRRELGTKAVEAVSADARQANQLIDLRTFSWTELFNHLETTLPPGVMITSVRPEVDRDGVWVLLAVVGRRVEDIDTFMEQLERTGAFRDLSPSEEQATEEGTYQAVLRGRYRPAVEEGQSGAAETGTTDGRAR